MSARLAMVEHHEGPTGRRWLNEVRWPSVADLVAYLREHPEEAVEVLATCKVAGPWRGDAAPTRDAWAHDGSCAVALQFDDDTRWTWLTHDGGEGEADDLAAAKRAADAQLVAEGWVLAGTAEVG